MNYTVIIPAAGEGKRMKAGKNKQLLRFAGKPLIIHTLSIFQQDPWCAGIILVVNPQEESEMRDLLADFQMSKVGHVIAGGRQRQDSVYEGLQVCEEKGIVLIHDGARPFVTIPVIHELVARAMAEGAAIPAIPVSDTIKKVKDERVQQTLARSSLWSVQTPQAFCLSVARDMVEQARQAGVQGTDDAALAEHFGYDVAVVESDEENIKITTPHDLAMARMIMERREE